MKTTNYDDDGDNDDDEDEVERKKLQMRGEKEWAKVFSLSSVFNGGSLPLCH